MNRKKVTKILRWTARIWSILILVFLLFMFIGHIFFPEEGEASWKTIELIAAIFFPIGVCLGMIIAWKKELIGGIVTVVSFIIFCFLILIPRGAIGSMIPMFLLISGPGFLFLINGLLTRKK